MINIQIDTPIKLSGKFSIKLKFEYNEEIVRYIKSFSPAIWNKKESFWELPIYFLSDILDTLIYYDEIKIKLPKEKQKADWEPLNEKEISEFKVKPFSYQVAGINKGLENNKWLLLDSPGLGKTNQIIWLAETLKRRGAIEHCFIICCVNSIKQNWKKAIEKFSTETCRVLGEKISKKGNITYKSLEERAEELKNPIEEFFVITNIESLRDDKVVEAFQKSKTDFGMIAVDEMHKANNKSSTQGANLLKLDAKYKIGATGTLLTNSPVSLYLPLNWIGKDHATLTNFKAQYCEFGGFNNSQVVGYKNLDTLKYELESCSLRRTKEEVLKDLPPKTVTLELVEMDPAHRKFYEAIKEGVKEEADKIELNSSNLLALTTRLRQATADPQILTSQAIESSKIERAVELAEELLEQGEKVVIISQFIPPAKRLAEKLARWKPSLNTSETSEGEFNNNKERFLNDPSELLYIGTAAKCSTGIDLNSASYMIVLDEFWGNYMNEQCFDRIHRANNTKPAFITVLACMDTIDERVHEISEKKKDLSDFIIDNKNISQSLQAELRNIINDL